ncbi:MAG: peptide chain release factor N(5)-glutamine methyltransferase [Desulfovermiculus sp.]
MSVNSFPLSAHIGRAVRRLRKAGVDSPRLSAELLLAKVLNTDRLWVITHPDIPLDSGQVTAFLRLVGRRATGEPMAYLLESKEFFGLEFFVTPGVLIPRPETEVLLETAGTLWPGDQNLSFVDVGTGSGAIGVGMAHIFPNSRGVLTDLSLRALRVAQKNIAAHHLDTRLGVICSDLLTAFGPRSIEAVLSNPPYLSSVAYWETSFEIRHFEPVQALWSGVHGTEVHVRLLRQARHTLRSGGWICLEIAPDQSDVLLQCLTENWPRDWTEVSIVQDWAGRDRVLKARRV